VSIIGKRSWAHIVFIEKALNASNRKTALTFLIRPHSKIADVNLAVII
jgi:hypothetical protein